ncbi:MAG: S-methyl-5'-thioadenosine phosphorylase [candidate division NC10 bacterium]|nr:S-methyl-5'-thioadenosine phosphorylase [candidate division NC10 bacterium]
MEALKDAAIQTVDTPFGPVSLRTTALGEIQVSFIARHGLEKGIPPHKVNYRAYISALKGLGVCSILATAATGTLNLEIRPGELALLTQFLDFTKSRPTTFFDEPVDQPVHLDMTEPYCPRLRHNLSQAAAELGLALHPAATYACTEGPRFETPAEIAAYRCLGADLVGMTNFPEVALAREAEICYAAVAVVTNYAAGISPKPLSSAEVHQVMDRLGPSLEKLFVQAIQKEKGDDCPCRHSLDAYPGERAAFGPCALPRLKRTED